MERTSNREPIGQTPPPRRAWPWGLVVMAVLVVSVESAVRSRLDSLTDWMSFTWRYNATEGVESAKRAEVVFLGDSLVKVGVLPTVVEQRLGKPVYNLAVQGGSAGSSYFLLERLIRQGGCPRTVVVDFHPNLLAVAPRSNEYWADLLTVGEAIDLGREAADPTLVVKTWLYQAFPTYRHRQPIRKALLASLRDETPFAETYNNALRANAETLQGARPMPIRSVFRPLDQNHANRVGEVWKAHRANAAYVQKLLNLAQRQGISVVWLLPPTTPEWLQRRREMKAEAAFESFVQGIVRRFPKTVIVDGRESSYPKSAFNDMTHLHAAGAKSLSLGLSEVLASLDPAEDQASSSFDRRRLLPPYLDSGPSKPFEFEVVDEQRIANALQDANFKTR